VAHPLVETAVLHICRTIVGQVWGSAVSSFCFNEISWAEGVMDVENDSPALRVAYTHEQGVRVSLFEHPVLELDQETYDDGMTVRRFHQPSLLPSDGWPPTVPHRVAEWCSWSRAGFGFQSLGALPTGRYRLVMAELSAIRQPKMVSLGNDLVHRPPEILELAAPPSLGMAGVQCLVLNLEAGAPDTFQPLVGVALVESGHGYDTLLCLPLAKTAELDATAGDADESLLVIPEWGPLVTNACRLPFTSSTRWKSHSLPVLLETLRKRRALR
jgi:hypothetical protein